MAEMNDRYLFRGKRSDNGEWIDGQRITDGKSVWIVTDNDFLVELVYGAYFLMAAKFYEVDPATVGQCTGERDKAGNLIFEGDILHPDDWDAAPVTWALNGWFLKYPDDYEPLNDIPDALIIGNIHDNPKLLRAKK